MTWDLFAFVIPIHGSQIGLNASAIGILGGAFGAAVSLVRLMLPVFWALGATLLIAGFFAARGKVSKQ